MGNEGGKGGGGPKYDGSKLTLGQPGSILIFAILTVDGILTILSKCANMLILRYYLFKRMLIKKTNSQ